MAFVFSCAYEGILHLGSFYTKRKKSTFCRENFRPAKTNKKSLQRKEQYLKKSLNLKFLLWSILYY